jgi:Protein of unknown function (DUF2971)
MNSDRKLITPQLEAIAADFGGHHAKQRIGLPKSPLYHYTTGDNLIRILQSGELWSTQAACMNDTKELIYAVEKFADRVKLAKDSDVAGKLAPLWGAVEDLISNPSANAAPIFLACFSERDDDLSQWRAYASGEGGYSIGFDAGKLWQGPPSEVYLMRVEYDESRMNFLLDDIIKWLVKVYLAAPGLDPRPPEDEWAQACVSYWLTNVTPFAIGLKHKAFEAEQEWRLFQYSRSEDLAKYRFKQRSSFMSRHLPLRIPKPLPVVSVRIGPCRHPELSRIAVGDLLIKQGYSLDKVSVELSQVPYRQD